ncbi:MAG: hypothetical protein O2983_10770 [Planctomycetota bacterium]|nr:hypothetical protein [Planctomycetota bacterium]
MFTQPIDKPKHKSNQQHPTANEVISATHHTRQTNRAKTAKEPENKLNQLLKHDLQHNKEPL